MVAKMYGPQFQAPRQIDTLQPAVQPSVQPKIQTGKTEFQKILETESLPLADLAVGLGVSLLVVLIAEVVKWFERGRKRVREYSTP